MKGKAALLLPYSRDLVKPFIFVYCSYAVSRQTAAEVESYLFKTLGRTPPARRFVEEFLGHWRPPPRPPSQLEEDDLMEPLLRPSAEELVLFKKGGKSEAHSQNSTTGNKVGQLGVIVV